MWRGRYSGASEDVHRSMETTGVQLGRQLPFSEMNESLAFPRMGPRPGKGLRWSWRMRF